MFTGIVSDIGSVIGVGQRNDVRRIAIACRYRRRDSIADRRLDRLRAASA